MAVPQPTSQCFTPEQLAEFLEEKLQVGDEARVMDHLGQCAACQRALEFVAANRGTWDDLKAHLADDLNLDPGGETIALSDRHRDVEMERLQQYLGPTDDPTMLGRLGSYEVCGLVGRGSTGVVVKALEPRLNRFVAIKVLSPNFSSNGPARTRFEREARAVAAVSHEHVVPIYSVDEYQGLPFIVMQYLPGGSLLQRIDRHGPLETTELVRVAMQVSRGLAAAHEQGIVHRDVKPANVLLEHKVDRAMVSDFGLARVADEAAMTRSGVIAGTPQYMSPEQAKGQGIDPRSDLFSLGSVMYHACTGQAPFRAETVFGVIQRVCETDPVPVRELNPNIDRWLEAFIKKLHSKDRNDRFESASQVAQILSDELAHLQGPTSVQIPDRPWFKRRRSFPHLWQGKRRLGAAVATGLLLLLSTALWLNGFQPDPWQNGFAEAPSMAGITDELTGDVNGALTGDASEESSRSAQDDTIDLPDLSHDLERHASPQDNSPIWTRQFPRQFHLSRQIQGGLVRQEAQRFQQERLKIAKGILLPKLPDRSFEFELESLIAAGETELEEYDIEERSLWTNEPPSNPHRQGIITWSWNRGEDCDKQADCLRNCEHDDDCERRESGRLTRENSDERECDGDCESERRWKKRYQENRDTVLLGKPIRLRQNDENESRTGSTAWLLLLRLSTCPIASPGSGDGVQ